MEVLAGPVGARLRAAAKQLGERIAAFGKVRIARAARVAAGIGAGIVTVKWMLRPFLAILVDLAGVEAPALFRIAQQGIGAGDGLEFLLGGFVPRVEVGVQLLGKIAIGFWISSGVADAATPRIS